MGVLWAMSLPGLVFLLVLVAALERFGLLAAAATGSRGAASTDGAPPAMKVDLDGNRVVPRDRLPGH
ncbi:hypothetical protein [Actinophytocola glycyrrhizae]|uniref:Uncharacterized protein n=1 Tax=Actinophytocola glycyrrhizae TaxID=2044873 RepID=A0ABV9RVZ6_9PSEU